MKLLKLIFLEELSLFLQDDSDVFFLQDFWMKMKTKRCHAFEPGQEILWLKTERKMMVILFGVEECKQSPSVADGSVVA
jgi:hypothetical protein